MKLGPFNFNWSASVQSMPGMYFYGFGVGGFSCGYWRLDKEEAKRVSRHTFTYSARLAEARCPESP